MPVIPTPPIQGSPPPILSVYLRDFTGGLNLAADDLQMPLNQFADALDVDLDVRGGFKRRRSFRSLGDSGLSTSTSKLTRLLFHYPTDTDNGFLLMGGETAAGDDKIAYWASSDITDGHARTNLRQFTTNHNTAVDYRWSVALMNKATSVDDEQLYIKRNYASKVQTFQSDGTLHAELTDAYGNYNDSLSAPVGGKNPLSSLVCAHSVYLFHADCFENSIRHPSRLRWSHPGQPGDYRTNDFIDVGEGQDNDRITALVSAQGRLFIFKRHSVWVLDGFSTNTFSIVKISDNLGCPNKMAAANYLDGVVFFDEASGLQRIKASNRTWSIEDMWFDLAPALSDGRLTNNRQAGVATVGTRIVVCNLIWNNATLSNRTFIYDEAVGKGWWWYSVGFSYVTRFTGSAGRHWLVGAQPFTNEGGASTTYMNFCALQGFLSSSLNDRFDATNDVLYNGYLYTPWVDAGDPARKKRFRRFSLTFDGMATNKSFTVNGYRNWSIDVPPVRTFTVTGTGTPTSNNVGQQNNVRGGALGTAYAAALKITGPNDVAWGINQVTFRFVPKRVT